MHWTDRRKRFRALLAGDRCIHPGSVFDPISARIAEDLGFELGMFAGSTASLTVLGAPDLIVLTLSEFAGQAYRINRAGNLPLMVDADHGYGNALNVMRTVQELETSGVAGVMIEDTVLPRAFGEKKPTVVSTSLCVRVPSPNMLLRMPVLMSPGAKPKNAGPGNLSFAPSTRISLPAMVLACAAMDR